MSDYIKHREYKLPNGRTVTADFDEYGIAKITIQALDAIFDNFINSADRVEVVRCKECKYQNRVWHEDKRFQDGGYYMVSCKRNEDPFVMHTVDGYDNDFCSFGERAES